MSTSGPKRVLVVDDEAPIREMIAEALHLDGYEVMAAANGAEALEVVRTTKPHVVVLDLMMPVMNGWQFLEACKRESACSETPVLVVSATHQLSTIARRIGASAYIAKPFDLDVLLSAVNGLAIRHRP